MSTVGSPTAAEAPQMQVSPTLMAGLPPMRTVALPMGKGEAVGWWALGGREHTWLSPMTQAGIPPIKTVASPGPMMVPPWLVVSSTLAAAGIFSIVSYQLSIINFVFLVCEFDSHDLSLKTQDSLLKTQDFHLKT